MNNILAVDDSAIIREAMACVLTEAGYAVTQAADGRQALDLAKRETFNLVLTDLQMPGMDGISLTRELRALPQYKSAPILTLTGEVSQEKRQAGVDAGATRWLIKPVDMHYLLATVEQLLDRKKSKPGVSGE